MVTNHFKTLVSEHHSKFSHTKNTNIEHKAIEYFQNHRRHPGVLPVSICSHVPISNNILFFVSFWTLYEYSHTELSFFFVSDSFYSTSFVRFIPVVYTSFSLLFFHLIEPFRKQSWKFLSIIKIQMFSNSFKKALKV